MLVGGVAYSRARWQLITLFLLFADEVRVRIVIQWGGRRGTAIKNRTIARNEGGDRVQARKEKGGGAPITGHGPSSAAACEQNAPQVVVVEIA